MPDRLGDFEFAPLARQLLAGNEHIRWVFVAGDAPAVDHRSGAGYFSIARLLGEESRQEPASLDALQIDPALSGS
jgi:hypothetical protein